MKTKPVKAAPMEARVMWRFPKDGRIYAVEDTDSIPVMVIDWSPAGQAALREKICSLLELECAAAIFEPKATSVSTLAALAPAKRKGRGK